MPNQRYYEIVAEELQRKILRPGLWTRAVAETGGAADAARAFYIRLRVAELEQIEQANQAGAAKEMERRAAAEAIIRKEQADAEMRARKEEERRRKEEHEAGRWQVDVERAASPYFGLLVIVGLSIAIFVICLLLPYFQSE